MEWLIVTIAVVGIGLNIKGRWEGFVCWLISNVYWADRNWRINQYEQAILFIIFALLSAYGLWKWQKIPPRFRLMNRLRSATIVIEHLLRERRDIEQDYILIEKLPYKVTARDITEAGSFAAAKRKAIAKKNETATKGKSQT